LKPLRKSFKQGGAPKWQNNLELNIGEKEKIVNKKINEEFATL
jgi:hypothetical protein